MEDRRKENGLLFVLGIAVGAAAGYYLNSESGRQLRRETSNRINRFGEDVSQRAREGWSDLSDNMSDALDRSKHYVAETGSQLRSRLSNLTNRAGDLSQSANERLNTGMEHAKRRIKKRIRKLEEAIETEMS